MAYKPIVSPGSTCTPDTRRMTSQTGHVIAAPPADVDLQQVHAWLVAPDRELSTRTVLATDAAIKYVLDGARSKRLHLEDARVDKDERGSVGTKLQYHILEHLELPKVGPLDTVIENVSVELKTTIRQNWTIPVEGQCQITLLVKIDTKKHQVGAWLMRTHREWLNEGTNQDRKRTISMANFHKFAIPVLPWTPLPEEPLRRLSAGAQDYVLGVGRQAAGITPRITRLLAELPNVVILRTSLGIVGGNADDFMKRAREAKVNAANAGLLTLVGRWPIQREMASHLGFNLAGAAWVAVSESHLKQAISGAPVSLSKPPGTDFVHLLNSLPSEVADEWRLRFRGL